MAKTKIYTAAQAISLFSEDGKYRPPYYKSMMADTIMGNSKKETIAKEFSNKMFNGPFYNLHRLYSYFDQNNYGRNLVKIPRPNSDLNLFNYEPYIDMKDGDELIIDKVFISYPSVDLFIDSYIYSNRPNLINLEYKIISTIPESDVGGNITILTDLGEYTFDIPPYNPNIQYLYLYFRVFKNNSEGIEEISKITIVSDFIDPGINYIKLGSETKKVNVKTHTTVVTEKLYENSDNDEVAETEIEDFDNEVEYIYEAFRKTEHIIIDEDNSYDLNTTIIHRTNHQIITDTVETEVDGVDALGKFKLKTTTTTERIEYLRLVETKEEILSNRALVNRDSFIYRNGSGESELDELFTKREITGFIPNLIKLKHDGLYHFPSNSSWDKIAEFNKVGLKRWFRKNATYEKLMEEISKGDATEIDNMCLFPFVDLYKDNRALLLYLYNAGKYLIDKYDIKPDSEFEEEAYYNRTQKGFSFEEEIGGYFKVPNLPSASDFSIISDNLSYTFPIAFCKYHIGTGKYKHNGKELKSSQIVHVGQSESILQGGYAITKMEKDNGGYDVFSRLVTSRNLPNELILRMPWSESIRRQGPYAFPTIHVVYQVNDNRWERIEIWSQGHPMVRLNWMHSNMDTHPPKLSDGMSGYPLPIIPDVLYRMPIIHANDVAQYCPYVLAHSWKKVKKKWYQTGLFTVVIIIVAVVLAVWSGGSSLGAASGILGTNATVGAAIGLTGMAAAIAGAVINAVAAMIVMNIVSSVAGKIFGEQIGRLIAIAAMYVIANFGSISDGSFSMSESFNNMMSIDNIMKNSLSVLDGIATKLNTDTQNMINSKIKEIDKLKEEEKKILDSIDKLYSNSVLDPLDVSELTEVTNKSIEPSSIFIARTLMNGTDMINLQNNMITDFVDMNLDLRSEMDPSDV